MLGNILVEQLAVQAHVGCSAAERATPQLLMIDIVCRLDVSDGIHTDDRSDCLDYSAIQRIVIGIVAETRCHLLERLAALIAQAIFNADFNAKDRIYDITIKIVKPQKLLSPSAAVGTEITFEKHERPLLTSLLRTKPTDA